MGAGPACAPLPEELRDPSLSSHLYQAGAEPLTATCGAVRAGGTAYPFCGFPTYPSGASRTPSGGLVSCTASTTRPSPPWARRSVSVSAWSPPSPPSAPARWPSRRCAAASATCR
jgi:hypothetical protein